MANSVLEQLQRMGRMMTRPHGALTGSKGILGTGRQNTVEVLTVENNLSRSSKETAAKITSSESIAKQIIASDT